MNDKKQTQYVIEPLRLDGIDNERPIIISGPCSAESEAQMLATAHGVAKAGVKIFRAGIWKPRTRPGGFEGVGAPGLAWLQKVKQETGMLVTTEVANRVHVQAALEAGIDLLWVGARTSANPFAVQEIADALRSTPDVPVLVKNPVNPDLELWIGALQRLYNAGIHRLGAIHRGFSAYGQHLYRNDPQWHIPIELHRRLHGLTILCDPSHMGGKRELIAPLSQQALDMGFDGLMIEIRSSNAIRTSRLKAFLYCGGASTAATPNCLNCSTGACECAVRLACSKKNTTCRWCRHSATMTSCVNVVTRPGNSA